VLQIMQFVVYLYQGLLLPCWILFGSLPCFVLPEFSFEGGVSVFQILTQSVSFG